MRMLMKVTMPHEPFNKAVLDGSVEKKMQAIMQELKPEAAYFIAMGGKRTGILIIDVPHPSALPQIAEPWFLWFHADVDLHVVMSPEDLGRAGLEELGKKWK